MFKPYIFAHRGAMGYCIENTIPCFKKAVEMGAGIETDLQLTKDKELVCFHDNFIKIDSMSYDLKNFTLEELQNIKFHDNRKIPTVKELFSVFKKDNNYLRYSCDIRGKKAGFRLIDIAEDYNILEKLEITERKLFNLSSLRKYCNKIKLVYTLQEDISKINNKTVNFNELNDSKVEALNIVSWRTSFNNFKEVIDAGFKCYVWGVNRKSRMKRILRMRYYDEKVDSIYTDYPDMLINLRNEISY